MPRAAASSAMQNSLISGAPSPVIDTGVSTHVAASAASGPTMWAAAHDTACSITTTSADRCSARAWRRDVRMPAGGSVWVVVMAATLRATTDTFALETGGLGDLVKVRKSSGERASGTDEA